VDRTHHREEGLLEPLVDEDLLRRRRRRRRREGWVA